MLTVEEQVEQIEQQQTGTDIAAIPTPEEINQQYELAEAYDRFIEVYGNHVVADPVSGEIINIFDMNVPVQRKADAIQWVIEKLENEQEMCDERKRLWGDKGKKLQAVIGKIRWTILQQMKQEGTEKIKTPENTLYIATKTDTVYDYSKLPVENIKVRVHIIEECSMREALEMGYSAEQMEFIGAVHPEDVAEDAMVKIPYQHLVIRTRK